MSKFVPWAGLLSDYLDGAGPDGVDRPGECHQPPTSAAKRNIPSRPENASSGLSTGPSTPNLQGQAAPPAGGGPSQGQGPTRKTAMDVRQMMWLAGGFGLSGAISHAEATMPKSVDPASERAGGEARRAGLKRKAAEISRSAAEDFALLTCRTTSESHAADFLSTVTNVTKTLFCLWKLLTFFVFQTSYESSHVPYKSLRQRSKKVVKKMLPDTNINNESLHEGNKIFTQQVI